MLSLYSKEEWLSLTKKAGSYSTELYFPIAYSVDAVPLCPQRLSDCQKVSTTVFIYLKLRLPILLSFKQLQFCLFKAAHTFIAFCIYNSLKVSFSPLEL